jgi:hypothetical protein
MSTGDSLVPREAYGATLEQTRDNEGDEGDDDEGHGGPYDSPYALFGSDTKVQEQDCYFGCAYNDVIDGFTKVKELSIELIFVNMG